MIQISEVEVLDSILHWFLSYLFDLCIVVFGSVPVDLELRIVSCSFQKVKTFEYFKFVVLGL